MRRVKPGLRQLAPVTRRRFLGGLLEGAALGWARLGSLPLKIFAGGCGLVVAMAIHALWNGLLTLDSQVDAGFSLTALDFILFPVELLFALTLFQLCLWGERRTLRKELPHQG